MTLFWFLMGLALVVSIARYNESNKLFWALLCALLVGVACGHIVSKCTAAEHYMDKKSLYQKQPTHGLVYASDRYLSLADVVEPTFSTTYKRVSKVNASEQIETNLRSVCRYHNTVSLPQTIKPPWLCYTSITTPHEGEG